MQNRLEMTRAWLYLNTVRHLRLHQIVWQIRNRFPPRFPKEIPNLTPRGSLSGWISGIPKIQSYSMRNRFVFLNEERELTTAIDWAEGASSYLWHYCANYFDFLNAPTNEREIDDLNDLIDRWIDENPPLRKPAWDPYPTSLRIVNWIRFHLEKRSLSSRAVSSLGQQAMHLSARPEYHLLGNHLFTNGKALVFAGVFFEGKNAEKWFCQGARILLKEIPEQFLEDGGHFERCPMYQGILLEDLLDLANMLRALATQDKWKSLLAAELLALIKSKIPSIFDWMKVMLHPDGEIPLFNDSSINFAPSAAVLSGYANRLELEAKNSRVMDSVVVLPNSGFARLTAGRGLLFANVGSVGPSYQPGHAHADSLTFELSVGRDRLIVDTGISTYEPSAMRAWQRSTAAHNTIEIDHENSSEVWSSFRVGRRARVDGMKKGTEDSSCWFQAYHTGYKRLPGVGEHQRKWTLHPKELEIFDELRGKGEHRVIARFLFHPDLSLEHDRGKECFRVFRGAKLIAKLKLDSVLNGHLQQADYCPEFGRVLSAVQVEGEAQLRFPVTLYTVIEWYEE